MIGSTGQTAEIHGKGFYNKMDRSEFPSKDKFIGQYSYNQARCERTVNSGKWPYVSRCENEAKHSADVPVDNSGTVETILVCDKCADEAKASGLRVQRKV